jgi:ubiquinone/menaquinone biosynthesis C-methylase UbiE
LIADTIEQRVILDLLKKQKKINSILEIGCGDGRNTINISKVLKKTKIDAFDFSSSMIDLANKNKKLIKIRNINFFVNDVLKLNQIKKKYDIVISKRCLINLNDFKQQLKVINSISNVLKKNGLFLMCENSSIGLKKINDLRKKIKLKKITPPWHNKYFNDKKLEKTVQKLKLVEKIYTNSTYYFLSRILNAYIAKKEKKFLDYNSEINRLALLLPNDLVANFSQGIIWLWRNKK